MRLIDADALKKELYKFKLSDSCVEHEWALQAADDVAKYTLDAIKNAPTIEAEPVRHAYWMGWEYDGYADGFPVFESWLCSECGEDFRSEGDPPAFDYCPRCGSKMDGDPDG